MFSDSGLDSDPDVDLDSDPDSNPDPNLDPDFGPNIVNWVTTIVVGFWVPETQICVRRYGGRP